MKRLPLPPPGQLAASLRDTAAPALALLTGARGSGKTSWGRLLVDVARAAGLSAAGLLSPPIFTQGQKTGIALLDIATGERRLLAQRAAEGESGTAGTGWRFDAATLAWGNDILASLPPADLVLIDEMGPLEFDGKMGFLAAFSTIDARRYRLALVTVRPGLLDTALARWPCCATIYDTEQQ